jgi:protein gp37
MATISTIEWTEWSWNPVIGCSICSQGCHHCYAMRGARRLKGVALAMLRRDQDPGNLWPYVEAIGPDGRWSGRVVLLPEALGVPTSWKKPRVVFVNSMSDVFHEELAVDDIRQVCEVMAQECRHTYQVLTKRAERMADLFNGELREFAGLPNVWWGVSVENVKHGLPRIDHLRRVPAGGLRFLSCEPLLEDLGPIDLTGIGWVIAGSESGAGARPCDDDWVRSLRDQCIAAGVKFFNKQATVKGKKVPLPLLDGRTWEEMPPACGACPARPQPSPPPRAEDDVGPATP